MSNLNERYTKAKRALFDKVYSARLNPEQCRAVFTVKGPLLVLAGAGSGKTTVLVNRIAYIVRYGNAYFSEYVPDIVTDETVDALEAALELPESDIEMILPEFITEPCPPWSVLAITFTNKAAREIKTRLAAAFDDPTVSESIWAGTFHSVCLRILHKFGDRLGYKGGFSIYDQDDSKRLVVQCMKELSIDEKRLSPKAVAHAISMAKDRLVTPDEYEIGHDPRSTDIKKIYSLYQKKLSEYNAVDFDDIIMKTVKLLGENEDVLVYYQKKFRFVLVDEYQDTNYAQFELTRLLADGYKNIMVVGDDDQSIYRFRGATVENILGFDKTYRDATIVKLEQNYRSTENILAAANAVIAKNEDRHAKSLWCDKGAGEKIVLRECADQNEEGRYIIDRIRNGVNNHGRRYSDYAILYRVNELARALETNFTKSDVPYRILGGQRFYDKKEIRDMLAYLSVVNTGEDNLRLKRIINEPKRKIGAATVDAIEVIATECASSMLEVIRNVGKYTALAKSADKLSAFAALIDRARQISLPSEIIKYIFDASGYRAMLEAEGFEGEGRIDSVNELISGALEYEKRAAEENKEPTLSEYLEEVSLVSDVDKYDEAADAVVLMTVHSAKGLEFPVVFLAGMEDGVFPSSQSRDDPSEINEERRLAYVAITRAKEQLYVTYTKNRMMYGRTNYNMLSCFIRDDVPEELIMRQVPRSDPGRSSYANIQSRRYEYYKELKRAPDSFTAPKKVSGAGGYGIEKIPVGAAVMHASFGRGVILSSKDMGGDVLYEVEFDSVGKKKLMSTYAKLQKI